jgi:transposase
MAAAPWIVSDALWSRIEPLLPRVGRRFRHPSRKRLPDRQALQGILFVLQMGIAWRQLPFELGFGGGSTCYRRMVEWQRAGVWERLHELLLAELRAAGELEWSRGRRLQPCTGEKGGSATGPSPVGDLTRRLRLRGRLPLFADSRLFKERRRPPGGGVSSPSRARPPTSAFGIRSLYAVYVRHSRPPSRGR